jgi:hypothetical protein
MGEEHIEKLEIGAIARLRPQLGSVLDAVIGTLNLISDLSAIAISEKMPKARFVRNLLLLRLQNDLRSCWILAERGYPLQAAGLAAGIFECWVTLASIESEESALRWLTHDREDISFGAIRKLTNAAVERTSGADKSRDADRLYSQYQQLCMPKHINPIIERSRGYTVDGKQVQFKQGPAVNELALAHAWFTLERGSRFAFLGLLSFISNDNPPLEEKFRSAISALHEKLERLQAESMERWPESYKVDKS